MGAQELYFQCFGGNFVFRERGGHGGCTLDALWMREEDKRVSHPTSLKFKFSCVDHMMLVKHGPQDPGYFHSLILNHHGRPIWLLPSVQSAC